MNKKAHEGFVTIFVIFLLTSITLFFMLDQRMLSYAHSLAQESAVASRQYHEILVIAEYARALVAHRFEDLTTHLQKTSNPLAQVIELPPLKKVPITVTRINNQELQVVLECDNYAKKYRCCASVSQTIDPLTGKKIINPGRLIIE